MLIISIYETNVETPYFFFKLLLSILCRCSVVVEALCYKPEGRAFDSR
jgi:hypothetical protein